MNLYFHHDLFQLVLELSKIFRISCFIFRIIDGGTQNAKHFKTSTTYLKKAIDEN